jgi:hypothetical protein
MKYRKRADGSLVTKSQLKAENVNISLPKVWTAATLDFLNVDPVLANSRPAVGEFERAVVTGAEFVNDNWVETWTVQPMFVEYTNDEGVVVTAAEQQTAYVTATLTKQRQSMEISMRQCRLALLAEGKLADVGTAIAALPEPTKSAASVEWEYGAVVDRLSPFVATLGLAIGYSDAELDTLFTSAADL